MSDNLHVLHGDLNPLLGTKVEVFELLNAPRFTASVFIGQWNGTEVVLIAQSAAPMLNKSSGQIAGNMGQQTTAIISISPGTAKELMGLLRQLVENHERTIGPIYTPSTPAEPLTGS
jgi:hypothetical protein